jgi:hypothetical protein
MPPRLLPAALVMFLGVFALSSSSRSAPFDFIYTDHVDVTLCPNGCGIMLGDYGFGLVVNKGATDIDSAEFYATTFTAVSSRPELELWPFISDAGPAIASIQPNEAVGSVGPLNSVLTGLLLPQEALRNTQPAQVIVFKIGRTGTNTYAGPVSFDVTMTTGGDVAQFVILADVKLGGTDEFALSFPSAARVSSQPTTTPVATRTWGALKALYR